MLWYHAFGIQVLVIDCLIVVVHLSLCCFSFSSKSMELD